MNCCNESPLFIAGEHRVSCMDEGNYAMIGIDE